MSVADRLRVAFAGEDFEEMMAVLDPDVVWPAIVAEDQDHIVVGMNLQQESDIPELHQLLTLRDDRVVEIQDFPDRLTALAAGGFSE